MTEREYYNFLKDNLAVDTEVQCQLDIIMPMASSFTGIIINIDWPWIYIERDGINDDEDNPEWAIVLLLSNCKYILPFKVFEDDWDININIPDEFPVRLEKEK